MTAEKFRCCEGLLASQPWGFSSELKLSCSEKVSFCFEFPFESTGMNAKYD